MLEYETLNIVETIGNICILCMNVKCESSIKNEVRVECDQSVLYTCVITYLLIYCKQK